MSEKIRVALVQMDVRRNDKDANRAYIAEKLRECAQRGAKLVVFPECALSGYVFNSLEEALPATESVPGETTAALAEICKEWGVYAVVGLLERDGEAVYNSAFIVGPEGLVGNYRKSHLPILGIDRYVNRGGELRVFNLPFARIGVLICYDVRFPEASRSLALQGADIIVLPTNWPQGAESSPDFLTRARAFENRVWLIACNRVGVEEGARFIGRSQAIDPSGKVMAEANGDAEEILEIEIEPSASRQKRLVFKPGVFEFDLIGGRRPELYGALQE